MDYRNELALEDQYPEIHESERKDGILGQYWSSGGLQSLLKYR